MLAMLSCAFFFHQADRALFGLLTIPIQKDLLLSDVQIGWINTVLSWTLAAMTTLAGFVGDKFSRKWIITISLMFWSLMTVCMGYVGDWKILGFGISAFACVMFFRSIATGGGESFYAPSAYALIAAHHKKTRSIALSIHQAALYIGLMCSGVIVAWSLDWLGSWRNVFILFGAAGFLLGVFFIFALKDNDKAANIGKLYAGAEGEQLINVAVSRARHKLITVGEAAFVRNIPGNTVTMKLRRMIPNLLPPNAMYHF
jgi:MFS family permease